MRKALKVIGILLVIIIVLIAGAAFYVKAFLPDVGPPPDLKIESTPEKVEKGRYLANHVMICMDCHSTRDWTYYAGPMKPDSLGMGGEKFTKEQGFPGNIYAANISPAGIGDWSDGEVFRAITTGVRKNGKPIFPLMPYHNYGNIDPEDIYAIIAYLRTLPPVVNNVPESEYDFPMNFIINTIPTKSNPTKKPSQSDSVAYGKYMVTAASCGDCHTPFDKGKFDDSKFLAGGRRFEMPSGVVTTANLTPDRETGIGNLSRDQFILKFAAYRDSAISHRKIDFMKDQVTVMPWPAYCGMTDEDLGAIYTYLQSLKPINHKVIKFQPHAASQQN
jgi:mono/diheme cytochrome c family protein